MSKLFTPVQVGRYELSNRLVMAPMTRSRASDADGVPFDEVATYYEQRSGAGLIVSSSRAILYASAGEDFAQAARAATEDLREKINASRRSRRP